MHRYADKKRAEPLFRKGNHSPMHIVEGLKQLFDDESPHGDKDSVAAVDQAIKNLAIVPALSKSQFKEFLKHFGVPIENYGTGKAKHLSDLWAEVAMGTSKLELESLSGGEQRGGEQRLVRSSAVAVAEVVTEVQGADQFLLLKSSFTDSGALRRDLDIMATSKMCADEEVETAIWRCLSENFDLPEDTCKASHAIESIRTIDKVQTSEGFPGLLTRYTLHIGRVRMHTRCLPICTEFMTSAKGDLGSVVKCLWTWCPREHFESIIFDSPDSQERRMRAET
jgi:hypothetical protein